MWKRSLSFLLALTLVLGASGTARADVTGEETIVETTAEPTAEPTAETTAETAAPVSEGVPVDEGHFPDGIFRSFVQEHCDLDGDGWLGSEEIGAVTELDVSGLGIETLQGVELFVGLRVLECQNNALTALNLTGNGALEELRCYRNSLSSLDLGGCPVLRILHCEKNNLTELNLEGNPALTTLQCQENRLTSLDVSPCQALDFLVCADNALPFLDLSANEKLTQVQAGGNAALAGLNENGVLDLSAIPGFDPARASGWTHASVSGTVLTPEPRGEAVTFTYDMGGGRSAVFSWQMPKTAGVPIDERHFPDANFRLVVSHQLDTTPDGVLTDAEIAGATRIEAERYEIASLEGLAYFTALRELRCGGNRLPFVDISANPLLTALSADGNQAEIPGRWDRTVDLSAIPGFEPARASGWDGGTVAENVLTAENGVNTVSFTYDADGAAGEQTVRLTWNLSFPERPTGIAIDEAVFPDENFRAYILTACDRNSDGILSDEEIKSVTSLDISSLNIASLTGAEVFTELRTMNCSKNNLTALAAHPWPRLEALDCSFNGLTALNLAQNSCLKVLNCAHNALTALEISDCPELRTLDCRDNGLEVLNVSRNDRLERLSCGENRLETLDTGKCPALAELNCDYNRLEALALPESGTLKMLSCNFNELTQLNLSAQRSLLWLFVGGNQLTALDLSGQSGLEKLEDAGNPMAPLNFSAGSLPKPKEETAPTETVPPETAPAEEACPDGHTFGPWIDQINPTCSETGLRAHRDCEICGRHFDKNGREIQDLTLPKKASNHRRTERTPRVEPTCTEDGFTAGVYCQDCGTYLTGHTPIPARHTLTPWVRATKDTPGHADCKICGKHFDGQGNEITID